MHCLSLGSEFNLKNEKFSFFIDKSVKAKVELDYKAGLYFPASSEESVQSSIILRIQGTLGYGQIGEKYSLFLKEDNYNIDDYILIKPFKFMFYMTIKSSGEDAKTTHNQTLGGTENQIHDEKSFKYKSLSIK